MTVADRPAPTPSDFRHDGRSGRDDRPLRPSGVLATELGPAASRRVRRRDEALAADGWTRRFIGGPPRLAEMIELYRAIGHEVRTEPLKEADLEDQCAGCALALSLFRVVYTRPPR